MHIPARAEIATVRAEHNRVYVIIIHQIAEPVAQFGIAVKRQRVFTICAGQGNLGNTVADRPVEMLGGGGWWASTVLSLICNRAEKVNQTLGVLWA